MRARILRYGRDVPQPWEPEHVVSLDRARALVSSQLPDLGPRTVEPFGAGFDNTAFLVNGEIVFRFPRRAIAVECLENEVRLLPRIAPQVPLAVPMPEWLGEPSGDFPWPWYGYRVLPGTTACRARPSPGALGEAAASLGRFLRALHAIPLAGLDAPGDTFHRADLERRKPRARASLSALCARGVVDDPTPWERLLDEATLAPVDTRLLHGDLYARHLLLDGAARPTGVIDWGDVHAGDPAVDLAVAFNFLPAVARPSLVAGYGTLDQRTWQRARVRALLHAIDVARYASDSGDSDLLGAARRALAYTLET